MAGCVGVKVIVELTSHDIDNIPMETYEVDILVNALLHDGRDFVIHRLYEAQMTYKYLHGREYEKPKSNIESPEIDDDRTLKNFKALLKDADPTSYRSSASE